MTGPALSRSERIVRGGALAALIALAATLVSLGIALERPSFTPDAPARPNLLDAETSARSHR